MKLVKYLIFSFLLTNIFLSTKFGCASNSEVGFAGLGKFFQNNSSNITLRDIRPLPFIITTHLVYSFLRETDAFQNELHDIKQFANSNIPEVQRIYQKYNSKVHQLYDKNKPACFVTNIQNLTQSNKEKADDFYHKLDQQAQQKEEELLNKSIDECKPYWSKQRYIFYTKNIMKATLISIPVTYAAIWGCKLLINKK